MVFRRLKKNKWFIDLDDQNSAPILPHEQEHRSVFDQLNCHEEYSARFSFIDDFDNRLYVHFAKFDQELAELEVRSVFSRKVLLWVA